MTAWPHKGRLRGFADAEPVASPFGEANQPHEAPVVEAVAQSDGLDSQGPQPVETPAADMTPQSHSPRLRRRWLLPAALLSGTAHAAAIYALVSWLDLRTVEASIDEVSIEIVVEPPDTAGAAAGQAQSDGAEVKPELPAGFIPPDPFAPELANAPEFPQPTEPVIVLPELPTLQTLAGPPPMPPVETIDLPVPGTLAILATPPAFETAQPVASAPPPEQEEAKRPVAKPKQRGPERPIKAAPKPQAREKPTQSGRKAEKKTAEASTRQPRNDRVEKPADTKREAARSSKNAASGTAGRGSGAKDRKQGEAGKRASAETGGAAQYGAQVNRHVQRFRRYPVEAAKAGIKGAVRVSIRIDSAGRLAGASVTSGSGHSLLDREALATVRRASPYPKPPAGVGPAAFSLTLRFSR